MYKVTIKFALMTPKQKLIALFHLFNAIFFNAKDNKWGGNAEIISIEKIKEKKK